MTGNDSSETWAEEIAVRVNEIDSGSVDTVSSLELWKKLGGKPNGQN